MISGKVRQDNPQKRRRQKKRPDSNEPQEMKEKVKI